MLPMNSDESMESERAAMHGRWRSTPLCILLVLASSGCHLTLKQCARDDRNCNEIHVKAPPQKVVVDLPRDEPCEPAPKPKPDQPSKPQSTPSQPQADQPSMPMGAPMSAPMGAPMAAPYAAIPSLPGGLALGLSFDWIRISIPIPRLRTVELPPEPSTAYVAMGGASVASPIVPAGYMQQQPQCYSPEQIAEAAAILRRQQGGSGSSTSAVEAELAKRERELEDKAKRLDDAAKKLDSLLNSAKGSADNSASNDRGGWRKSPSASRSIAYAE